jgi:hypothetical protein
MALLFFSALEEDFVSEKAPFLPLNQTIYKCPRKDLGFSTGLAM